jgi:hypothetical protein
LSGLVKKIDRGASLVNVEDESGLATAETLKNL